MLYACKVQESSSSSNDIVINVTEIYENFKNIKTKINIDILPCYKILFKKESLINNIAFYILIIIILLHLIFIIIFYSKDLNKIKAIIKEIVFAIKNWKLVKDEEKKENKKLKKDHNNKKKKNNDNKNEDLLNINKSKKKRSKSISKLNTDNEIINTNKNENRNRTNSFNNKNKNDMNKNKRKSLKSSKNTLSKSLINEKAIIEKVKKIMEYNKQEKNELLYKEAIKYDSRTYCEYYISLMQTKHVVIFSFYLNNDYNSRIIKIDLFFNSFIIYLTINALFFSDGIIHRIYDNRGNYQLLYQLPQIIYSTLISSVLNLLLKALALSEDQ